MAMSPFNLTLMNGRKKGKMRCAVCLVLIFVFRSFSEALNVQLTSAGDFTSSKVHKYAVEVLQQCFNNQKAVIVYGDLEESATETLSSQLSVNVIHYSDAINYKASHPYAANSFLITANSGEAVRERLTTLRGTPWWNSMGAFFIVQEGSDQSCENVEKILRAAWKMDVVTGFFLCENSQQEVTMYTYNPFTNRAPQPWWESGMVPGRPGRWTLFKMSNTTGDICKSVSFDRTRFLDGSKLRVVAYQQNLKEIPADQLTKHPSSAMFPIDVKIIESMQTALNATVDIQLISFNPAWKYEKMHPCVVQLANASADLALCMRNLYNVANFTPTYIMAKLGFTVITQQRGLYTPLEKMWNYYGPVTVISMAVLLSMTFVVVWYSDKYRSISFAGYEVLRLLINTAINTRLDTLAKRIFFLCIFLYFLIMHATFSGHISAFLTKDEMRKNVESLEDLRDGRYTVVYSDPGAVKFVTDPEVLKKIVIPPKPGCYRQVMESDQAACINAAFFGVFNAIHNKLHFMKKMFGHVSAVYPTRHDFSLKNRVDTLLMWLEQSGLSHRWMKIEVDNAMTKQRARLEQSLVNIRPISLQMLPFAFYILGFGLSLATICFVFEIVIGRKKLASVRRQT